MSKSKMLSSVLYGVLHTLSNFARNICHTSCGPVVSPALLVQGSASGFMLLEETLEDANPASEISASFGMRLMRLTIHRGEGDGPVPSWVACVLFCRSLGKSRLNKGLNVGRQAQRMPVLSSIDDQSTPSSMSPRSIRTSVVWAAATFGRSAVAGCRLRCRWQCQSRRRQSKRP